MTPVLGIDGCPGGWVGAEVDGDLTRGRVRWRFWDVDEAPTGDGLPTAVDMPIGLPEAGRRACDLAAREFLGSARSSIFPVPSRPVLDLEDYAEACASARRRGEPAPSRQLWGLRRRIRVLDAALSPTDQSRVVECHPEVAFRTLAGPVLGGKRTAAGLGRRMAALGVPADVLAAAPPQAGPDDALDALVCAWTARRWIAGEAVVFGDDARDGRGLRMQIVA